MTARLLFEQLSSETLTASNNDLVIHILFFDESLCPTNCTISILAQVPGREDIVISPNHLLDMFEMRPRNFQASI